jgi:hypothetical protein
MSETIFRAHTNRRIAILKHDFKIAISYCEAFLSLFLMLISKGKQITVVEGLRSCRCMARLL